MQWFDCGRGGVLVIPEVGEFEIHLRAGAESLGYWVALREHACSVRVPTGSDLPRSASRLQPPVDDASSTTPSVSLEQVHRGEVLIEHHLRGLVNDATRHLQDTLSPEQLAVIESVLWESLDNHPDVAELVRCCARARSRAC